MQLTKNFTIEEFCCKDGHPVPQQYLGNVQLLANNLQVLRDSYNLPIRINSGYRTPRYNKEIGGVPTSQHLYAKAADFYIFGISPKEIAAKIEELIKSGEMSQGGIGIYDTWVHYDVRGVRARWDLRKRK